MSENVFFATRLCLETHETIFQENYGVQTSLSMIFRTFTSLSGLIFKTTQICQQVCELCYNISSFFDVQR